MIITQYVLLHTVFSISNYTSYFLGLVKHRLFYIELHTVNSLLNTAKKFYILLSTVLSISNYSSQILYIIKLSRLYIQLLNVFFASKFGWKTLYSTSHRLYLSTHRLYSTYHRLFMTPVMDVKVLYPTKLRLYSIYHGLYPTQPRQKYIQLSSVYIELQAPVSVCPKPKIFFHLNHLGITP